MVNTVVNKCKKIVVLVSGSGSNLQAIMDAIESGDINGCVVAVISNVPYVFALERASKSGIPAITLDHKQFSSRHEFDQALSKKIKLYSPDLVVLAGFMRILSEQFVSQFAGKMLNIHPSLLPKYPGLHTHKKVIQNKDSEHGASIHFVTKELDGGPVVVQSSIVVDAIDDETSIQAKVAATEWHIYPLVVSWFCQDALRLEQDSVWLCKDIVTSANKLILIDSNESSDQTFACKILIKEDQGEKRNEDNRQ